MIQYPLSMPATPGPRSVEWMPHSAVAAVMSPFTFQRQTQAHQGQLWEMRITLPPMEEATAAKWIAKLLSLNGMQGTFLFGDSIRKVPAGLGGSPIVNGAGQQGQELLTKGWPLAKDGLLIGGMDWIQIGGFGSELPWSGVPSWLTDLYIISRGAGAISIGFSDPCPVGGGVIHWSMGSIFQSKAILAGESLTTITHNIATGTARLYKVLNDVNSDGNGEAVIDIWPRLREAPDDNASLVLSDCKGTFHLKDNVMDWSIDFAKIYGMEIDAVEHLG